MSRKNYTYGWVLEQNGFKTIPKEDYTESQLDMKAFVESMAEIIRNAKCGWDDVRYEVMGFNGIKGESEYMVLYVGEYGERWIPITGNSKGYNFTVLGENLW